MATSGLQSVLAGTKPWVRLVSILGFISSAFMILGGVAAAVMGASMLDVSNPGTVAILFIYPLLGLLYLVPSFYLFRFASRIGDYVRGGQEGQLELALASQRSFWRFVGILSLLGIVVMSLGMAAAIAIPWFLRPQVP